jgi:hypothetical protein
MGMRSGAWRALLLFFVALGNCAGRFGEDSSTLARQLGGAMEGKQVGAKNAKVAKRKPDPEIGSGDIVDELLEYSEAALRKNIIKVLKAVIGKIEVNDHIPATKFVMDFVRQLRAMKQLPQEDYESFAAVLWREYRVIEGEGLEIWEVK